MKAFINLTNHPSNQWDESQRRTALTLGEITDIPFPAVDPYADEAELAAVADRICDKITGLNPAGVLCQGEMGLTYLIVTRLIKNNIPVYHACSRRDTVETKADDGSTIKTARFVFVRFRRYQA